MNRMESAQGTRSLTPRGRARAIAFLQAQRKRELEANLAVLQARRDADRSNVLFERLIHLWPLWLGIVLGVFSPAIQILAKAAGPSCMALLFPFVMLAKRPEIQVGPITHFLPTVMLYGQFPIEGLLARIVIKRRIRPWDVAWHVLMFHLLGIAELLMLSGAGQYFSLR
jgi:hypothetical protein